MFSHLGTEPRSVPARGQSPHPKCPERQIPRSCSGPRSGLNPQPQRRGGHPLGRQRARRAPYWELHQALAVQRATWTVENTLKCRTINCKFEIETAQCCTMNMLKFEV